MICGFREVSACSHTPWELMWATDLSLPVNNVPLQVSTASGCYHLSTPVSWWSIGYSSSGYDVKSHLELIIPQSLILCLLTSLCVSVLITISCKKKFLWWGLKGALIFNWREELREKFNTVTVYQYNSIRFSPVVYDLDSIDIFPVNRTHHEVCHVELSSKPRSKWLVSPITFMPLLHKWAYLVRQIVTRLIGFIDG